MYSAFELFLKVAFGGTIIFALMEFVIWLIYRDFTKSYARFLCKIVVVAVIGVVTFVYLDSPKADAYSATAEPTVTAECSDVTSLDYETQTYSVIE